MPLLSRLSVMKTFAANGASPAVAERQSHSMLTCFSMAKGYIAGSRTTRARNGAVRDFKEIFMNLRRQFWLVVIPGLALLLLTVTNAEQIDGRRRSVPAVELAQAVARPKTATAAQSHQQDEKAIRANVDAMTKAFNDKDAAA